MSYGYNPSMVTNGLLMNIDAANPKSYSANVFANPLDTFAWCPSGGYQMTSARDTTVTDSPAGGIPLKLVTSGTSAYSGTYNSSTYNVAPAATGQTWTVSFWVKASSAVTASMLIFEANSAGNYTAYGQPSYNVTTSWTRVTGTYTMTQATTAYIQIRIDCYVTGITLWVDGIQVERASSATKFNSLTNTNGTSWYDLTRNGYNATTTGYPTVSGGVMQFNASNYASVSNINLSTSHYTVVGAARYSGATRGRMINAISNNWLMGHWSNSVSNYYAAGWVTGAGVGGSDTTWRIYHATGNIATGIYQLYINDTLYVSAAGGTAGPNGLQVPQGGGEQSVGECGFILAYNRVLSANEVKQNFYALRGRYGI